MPHRVSLPVGHLVRAGASFGALSGFVGAELYIVAILILSTIQYLISEAAAGSSTFRISIWVYTVVLGQVLGVLPAVLIGAFVGGVAGFLFTIILMKPSAKRGLLLGLLLALVFSLIGAKLASIPLAALVLPIGSDLYYPSLMFVIILCAGGWSGRQLAKRAQFYWPDS